MSPLVSSVDRGREMGIDLGRHEKGLDGLHNAKTSKGPPTRVMTHEKQFIPLRRHQIEV